VLQEEFQAGTIAELPPGAHTPGQIIDSGVTPMGKSDSGTIADLLASASPLGPNAAAAVAVASRTSSDPMMALGVIHGTDTAATTQSNTNTASTIQSESLLLHSSHRPAGAAASRGLHASSSATAAAGGVLTVPPPLPTFPSGTQLQAPLTPRTTALRAPRDSPRDGKTGASVRAAQELTRLRSLSPSSDALSDDSDVILPARSHTRRALTREVIMAIVNAVRAAEADGDSEHGVAVEAKGRCCCYACDACDVVI